MQKVQLPIATCIVVVWLAGSMLGSEATPESRDVVRERIDIMEKIGEDASAIGDALKAGDTSKAAALADEITAAAKTLPELFPAGSIGPDSRAKPEIWSDAERFAELFAEMPARSAAIADAARNGGEARKALFAMFKNCKACHRDFRQPDDDAD